uniref:Uncharacterized protein n=1 Tax=Cyprinus carpio TaxID=7962 RepID=A0A8C1R8H2_CYPCA
AMIMAMLLLFIMFSMGNADVQISHLCTMNWKNILMQKCCFFSSCSLWEMQMRNYIDQHANLTSVHNELEKYFLTSLLPSTTQCWLGVQNAVEKGQWL